MVSPNVINPAFAQSAVPERLANTVENTNNRNQEQRERVEVQRENTAVVSNAPAQGATSLQAIQPIVPTNFTEVNTQERTPPVITSDSTEQRAERIEAEATEEVLTRIEQGRQLNTSIGQELNARRDDQVSRLNEQIELQTTLNNRESIQQDALNTLNGNVTDNQAFDRELANRAFSSALGLEQEISNEQSVDTLRSSFDQTVEASNIVEDQFTETEVESVTFRQELVRDTVQDEQVQEQFEAEAFESVNITA